MNNIEFLIGRTIQEISVFDQSPHGENGNAFRNLTMVLDNGMSVTLTADDDIQPYDPFFHVDIEVTHGD